MKLRSVLKKLKKKKKSSSDGIVMVHDEPVKASVGPVPVPEEETVVRTAPKAPRAPVAVPAQRPPAAPSSASNTSSSSSSSRIRSRAQQQQQQQTAQATQGQPSPANKLKKNKSSSSFQDDFGVEEKAFLPNSGGTWASFGDSSGFFNSNDAEHSGSLFTASTAMESQSTIGGGRSMSSSSLSSMSSPASSPANSSFRSPRSPNSSSPADLSIIASRSRSSESPQSGLSSSLHDNKGNEEKHRRGSSPTASPPRQEGRSDMSLPLPESLQVGATQETRQRASPPVLQHKTEPPMSSISSISSYPSPPQEPSQGASPTASVKSIPTAPPAPTKRNSITARYTSALNSSTSSPSAAPKLFRSRSKTSILDNHPLFRKRSMVEQETIATAKQQAEEEREEAEANENNTPESPPKIGRISSSNDLLADLSEEQQTEEESVPPPPSIAPLGADADADADIALSEDGSHDMAKEAVADATSTNLDTNLEEATEEEVVSEQEEEPTMEQDQPGSSDSSQASSEDEQEEEQMKLEESQAASEEEEEDEMPILSTAPEFDAVPPPYSTADTMESSVAQSSKATTISLRSNQSDEETAPIGELSFDSHSEGSQTMEHTIEGTVDYTIDPDAVSVLSEDFTAYTHELRHSKRRSDRMARWIENTIFGMANFMCPISDDGDVYDA